MKFLLQYIIAIVLFTLLVSDVQGSQQVIILTHASSETSIMQKKEFCKQIIKTNKTLNQLNESQSFTVQIKKVSTEYLIELDAFKKNDELILVYLILKEYFPEAFITDKTKAKTAQPKVQKVLKKVVVEKDDTLSWIAIFSLALVGILVLFISSREMKKIDTKYTKMQEKQHNIELFLTQMGENIYNLTREAIKEDENNPHEEKKNHENIALNSIKNRLFDETKMMIYFLKLKSKNIKITQESFNLNTMLSSVLGTLSNNFKDTKIELIFDIDHMVPKVISTDLLHLSEILIELLQNAMQYSVDDQVRLKIFINTKNEIVFQIMDTSMGIDMDDLENLFMPTYTKDDTYKGVGLYVANELTKMMGGELNIEKNNVKGVTINCVIPLLSTDDRDKRKYRLPDKTYIKKRTLLCEDNEDSSKAIKKSCF